MARGDQLSRQWKIISYLSASRRGKQVSELAHDLDCHPRTVYRDLEALQQAGFPLIAEKFDNKSLWGILDTFKNQTPIPLSITELMALYFSRGMLGTLKGTVFHDSLESFLQKVQATLPDESLGYIEEIEKAYLVSNRPLKEYGKFKERLDILNQALISKQFVSIDYFTMSKQEKTSRQVAPYRILFVDGTFYLIGMCSLRNDIRIFALDRIENISIMQQNYEVPDDFSAEELLKTSFGVFVGGDAVHVKVRFLKDCAGYISEKNWHPSQEITEEEDGSIIFKATVAGLDDVKFWIMKWGASAIVLEPESLKNEILLEAEKILKQYQK